MSPRPKPFEIALDAVPPVQAPQYVIGARSYLTDRSVPLPEIVVIPARRAPECPAVLRYDGVRRRLPAVGSRRRKLVAALQPAKRLAADVPVMDLRPLSPANWSHAFNIALPLALMVRDRLTAEGLSSPVFICPQKMPAKILGLFSHFGLECLCTSGRVSGALIRSEPDYPHAQSLYQFRQWLAPHKARIDALISAGAPGTPDRVFLDRRDGRALSNGAAVRAFLEAQGFVTVYPEDLSLAQQVALLCTASDIVAIHGAGIAPLMLRQPEAGPFRFVEILSPGLVMVYFRAFTEHLPADYRMIRGRPTSEMGKTAYDIEAGITDFAARFAMTPFEVDLATLELALRPERIEDLLWAGEPLDVPQL